MYQRVRAQAVRLRPCALPEIMVAASALELNLPRMPELAWLPEMLVSCPPSFLPAGWCAAHPAPAFALRGRTPLRATFVPALCAGPFVCFRISPATFVCASHLRALIPPCSPRPPFWPGRFEWEDVNPLTGNARSFFANDVSALPDERSAHPFRVEVRTVHGIVRNTVLKLLHADREYLATFEQSQLLATPCEG